MLTPQKAAGQIASGKAKMMGAIKLMQMALLDFPPQSPEFQAGIKAIAKLTEHFGKTEEDSKQLMPAELMSLMQSQAGPGAPGGMKPPMPAAGGAPPPAAAAA